MVIVILVGLALIVLANARAMKGILEVFHKRLSEDSNSARSTMLTAVQTMRDVRNSCFDCRAEVLAAISSAMGAQVERLLADNRVEHDDTRACLEELHRDFGREGDKTAKELQTINGTLLALFPQCSPPPVGGTGSAVRDSAASGK